MQFEFATATAIIFGPGTMSTALSRVSTWGQRALVVSGKTPQRYKRFFDRIKKQGFWGHLWCVEGEPTVESITEGVAQARKAGCDMVVGIGGGSVIDTGKAIAAMLTNTGQLTDYLEIVGEGRPLQKPSAPYAAIPTTAGTGAEVTRNAVLTSPAHRIKVSMRSPSMLPQLVVVDPELTVSLPPETTAATGMDALTQLIEAYVSLRANPLTDALCREGLVRCARSLTRAYDNGQDMTARTDMCMASLFSGLALANGGLGAVHGIAGPLGGYISVPHGVACGRLLSPVVSTNARRLVNGDYAHANLKRFMEIARILTGRLDADVAQVIDWIDRLCQHLQIPSLSRFGLEESDFNHIAANALNASSMKGNPVKLDKADLISILKQTLVTS